MLCTRYSTVAKLTSKPSGWVVMLCTDMTHVAAESSSSLLRYYLPPRAVIPSIAAKWITWAMQPNSCSLWLNYTCSMRERDRTIAKFVLALSAVMVESFQRYHSRTERCNAVLQNFEQNAHLQNIIVKSKKKIWLSNPTVPMQLGKCTYPSQQEPPAIVLAFFNRCQSNEQWAPSRISRWVKSKHRK